jgi:predicted O-methyltransferase YrrM
MWPFHMKSNSFRPNGSETSSPTVLISVCEGKEGPGDYPYNGGIKLLNLWTKILRMNGYEAYMVTYSGDYRPWLIEHQPHVSIEQVKRWKKDGRPLKFFTGWIPSRAFIDLADEIYFYDAELKYTCSDHFGRLQKLLKNKIRRVSTHSRTQQAWYMATFGLEVNLIPVWSDEAYWFAQPACRKEGLIGYMNESDETKKEVEQIAGWCREAGVRVKFLEISGDESEVIKSMQSCDIYLGMNPGKHPLWGEGSPLTQQEAMHAGCVVIAYDVYGNREYLIDAYTGFLAKRKRPTQMAELLIGVLRDPELKERIRMTSLDIMGRAFTSSSRWNSVRDFLELKEVQYGKSQKVVSGITAGSHAIWKPKRAELQQIMDRTAYIHDDEIPILAGYASMVKGNIVEIGAGYGASTAILLMNANDRISVHSIDPFVRDSMSTGLHSSVEECRNCVKRVLLSLNKGDALDRWKLHVAYNQEVVISWKLPIELIYLDGDHHYEVVRRDFENWLPYVQLGGYILLHDSRRIMGEKCDQFARGWIGPTRLAEELRTRSDLELIDESYSMTVWRRK